MARWAARRYWRADSSQSGYVVAALADMDGAAGQVTAWIAERLPK